MKHDSSGTPLAFERDLLGWCKEAFCRLRCRLQEAGSVGFTAEGFGGIGFTGCSLKFPGFGEVAMLMWDAELRVLT